MNTYDNQLAALTQDLLNTEDPYQDVPELLPTPDTLVAFLELHDIPHPAPVDVTYLRTVWGLRDQLRAIWEGAGNVMSIQRLNHLLAIAPVMARFHAAGDNGFLTFDFPDDTPLLARLSAQTALGIVASVQAYGWDRLKTCDADPCQDAFIDASRNRSRRFCSDRCANRYNIAHFRARQHKD